MARRLFFVPEVRRGTAQLTGPDAEHLVRVLRAEAGQIYEISDNERRYLAQIEQARKSAVTFQVIEELPSEKDTAVVCFYPALFKFDRFEWMVEKATELGVTIIEPFEAIRSDKGLAQAAEKRVSRWERIGLEASQQARRVHLPIVTPPSDLSDILTYELQPKLLLDESSEAPNIISVIEESHPERNATDRIGLMLGPEGGWTDSERKLLTNAGWTPCSLGSTVLRAETAAVAGLSIVNALWSR